MRTVLRSIFLMLAIAGCDASGEQNPRQESIICAEIPYIGEGPNPCAPRCDPRRGTRGTTVVTQRAVGLYQYHDVWCSVGRPPLLAGCYGGFNVRSQSLASMVCRTPVGGSCTDPNAEYDVTCNAVVDCIYDCDGECNPVSC